VFDTVNVKNSSLIHTGTVENSSGGGAFIWIESEQSEGEHNVNISNCYVYSTGKDEILELGFINRTYNSDIKINAIVDNCTFIKDGTSGSPFQSVVQNAVEADYIHNYEISYRFSNCRFERKNSESRNDVIYPHLGPNIKKADIQFDECHFINNVIGRDWKSPFLNGLVSSFAEAYDATLNKELRTLQFNNCEFSAASGVGIISSGGQPTTGIMSFNNCRINIDNLLCLKNTTSVSNVTPIYFNNCTLNVRQDFLFIPQKIILRDCHIYKTSDFLGFDIIPVGIRISFFNVTINDFNYPNFDTYNNYLYFGKPYDAGVKFSYLWTDMDNDCSFIHLFNPTNNQVTVTFYDGTTLTADGYRFANLQKVRIGDNTYKFPYIEAVDNNGNTHGSYVCPKDYFKDIKSSRANIITF